MPETWLTDMSEAPSIDRVGGKAAGLYRLTDLGLAVPRFAVLTAECFRAACPDGSVPESLPSEAEEALDRAWGSLGAGCCPLAVRSSALEEDSGERSYAGQMETFLNVAERRALSDGVLGCWRSLHGERAAVYRAAAATPGADEPSSAMAVVIQEMIEPTSAGVLFTVNPADGRAEEILVSSVWGLGEGLVSGALDADTFVLDRTGRVKTRHLAEKREMIVPTPSGGTTRTTVPQNKIHSPSLDDSLLAELARAAIHAEELAGRPQDIEFAVADGKLCFLQARPVTGFVPRARPEDGHRQVWDNSNIIESYPGITLPLTFSFIKQAYRAVYWQFCEVLGLSSAEIGQHEHMLSNMLGLIQGRVYYNLLNWYRLVALLPGFRFNKGFMEAMMGVHEGEDLQEAPLSARERYLLELPKLIRGGLRAILLHRSLPRRVERFHRDFDAVYERFVGIDFDALPPDEALAHYRELARDVLWRWKAPIINDFSAMIFYGALKKLPVGWDVDPDGSVQNPLSGGQGAIESTQVTDRLLDVARVIAEDEEFRTRFVAAAPGEALRMARSHARAGSALDAYLREYGDRCIEELKLESKSMRDDPTFCVSMLQNYLRSPLPALQHRGEGDLRRGAEAAVRERLRGKRTAWGLPKLPLYRWVLKHARAAVRNRENQRLARTRAYALVRGVFRSIGRSFCRNGLLETADDIFYLEINEIARFIDGTSATANLKALVTLRRAEYATYEARSPLPDHFETHGLVYAGNEFEEAGDQDGAGDLLTGLGACPGVVERNAVVLLKPDTSTQLDGEILVTRHTDPGWVVLFPSISGLVVERGSMLSHSAIVAREMGIPAVVGVRHAASLIRSDDRLRLDGAKGTVQVLERDEGGEP